MSISGEIPRTVLIVDDRQALLGAFVLGLPLVGPFEVMTASNGAFKARMAPAASAYLTASCLTSRCPALMGINWFEGYAATPNRRILR